MPAEQPQAADATRALPPSMRAVYLDRYGPPESLRIADLPLPVPGDKQVLVRVRASCVRGDDWHLIRGLPYAARMATGIRRPKHKVLGLDVAGEVVVVGTKVTEFAVGDQVFGWCQGGLAEFVAADAEALLPKPEGLSFEQAAAVPISGFTALQAVRDRGEVQAAQKVLITGASGSVGTFAVQIAKQLGAEVTGVCSSRNVELVRSLGADQVIDYTQQDFTEMATRYDVIVDFVQAAGLKATHRALAADGTLVMVGSSAVTELRGRARWFKGTDRWIKAMLLSIFSKQRLRPLVHQDRAADLRQLADWLEAGKLRPVLDSRVFDLADTAAAIRYTEERQACGTVAVRVV